MGLSDFRQEYHSELYLTIEVLMDLSGVSGDFPVIFPVVDVIIHNKMISTFHLFLTLKCGLFMISNNSCAAGSSVFVIIGYETSERRSFEFVPIGRKISMFLRIT